ncbi:MAG TPA: hypothetical protein VFI30_03485 [Nocardioidaceae bacterium]|nr:hypothetical protein [Nocardioidaceae bacterium]
MPPEYVAGFVFLASVIVLGAGFIFSARAARHGPDDYEPIHHTGYRVRRYWFVGLMALGLIALGLTLPHMPYPLVREPASATPVTVVHVTGQQWYWTISPSTVTAGQVVEFEVTSKDVNHDFGIYDANSNIVGQVQAMPGVTNHLYMTFKKPGTYPVRCLELCGLDHTLMTSAIIVKPAKG